MAQKNTSNEEISKYFSTVLENHFGENSAKVEVIVQKPFIVIHLLNFLLPSEQVLMKKEEHRRIWKTRDLVMNDIKPELIKGLSKISSHNVTNIYADWNLDNRSGVFIAVIDEPANKENSKWPEKIDKQALIDSIIHASKRSQKEPEQIDVYWMDDKTILIERTGIMVDIERELIKNGVIEELRLAKRPLEHRLMDDLSLKAILNQSVSELFADWNFEDDKAYLVLFL